MASALLATLGLGLGLSVACSAGSFTCISDGQCNNGTEAGICQPSGWCSFEDPDCDSNQRYADHSGPAVAGTCVPVADGPTSGPAPTGSGDDITTDNVTDDATDDATGATDDSPPTADGASSTDATSADSGPDPQGCVPVLYDDFSDDVLDPVLWWSWIDRQASLVESESLMRFSVEAGAEPGMDAGIVSSELHDFTEGYVRVQVAEPPSNSEMRLYWHVADAQECAAGTFIHGDQLYGDETVEPFPGIPGELTWLQIRFEDGLVFVEYSADGEGWELILPPSPTQCNLAESQVMLFGGAGGWSLASGTTSVATIEACAMP